MILTKERKNTLHLKQVSRKLIEDTWGFTLPRIKYNDEKLYMKCNKKGIINWNGAYIYTAHDLVEVNKIKLV